MQADSKCCIWQEKANWDIKLKRKAAFGLRGKHGYLVNNNQIMPRQSLSCCISIYITPLPNFPLINLQDSSNLLNSSIYLQAEWKTVWLRGRVLDSRPRGRGFEPHRRHCVVVLEQDTFILA